MTKVLRSISAHTSRRGSNAQNVAYADLLEEFDPLSEGNGGGSRFARGIRTPVSRPQSAMAFDFNQQKAAHLAASNASSEAPSPLAKQTGPQWEAFYASFGNEVVAPAGERPVPPPKPASVTASGSGQSGDSDESMGAPDSDEEPSFDRSKSSKNFAQKKKKKNSRRAQSQIPQSSHLRDVYEEKKRAKSGERDRKSRSHRSSRRTSKTSNKPQVLEKEKRSSKKGKSRSSSRDREGKRLSEKRSPFAKTLQLNPFDELDDADEHTFHEEAGEPGAAGSSSDGEASASSRTRRQQQRYASAGTTPVNGVRLSSVPKTPRRSKKGARGTRSAQATPRSSEPIVPDLLGSLRVSASAPKINGGGSSHSRFDIGLSPIVDVPETPYLNGNDPDDHSDSESDSESASESVPATPSTNNFTFTVDSVPTPATSSSKKERRRPATTRNRSTKHRDTPKRRSTSRRESREDISKDTKRASETLNRRKERRHARSRTTPADFEEADELRERYEARKAERKHREQGGDDGQLSAHGLAHSKNARIDSINTLQREYGLDGRARRVVKEVWAPHKVTMTQINVWEGDWLMEAYFEFSNFTSSKVPVAIKFMRFNSNHRFLQEGERPFYPNLEERNIAILEPNQADYRFFAVRRRAKVGPKDKLELNYRFGYKRLGRWNMAW